MSSVTPLDFARRRSAHQTARDRRRLRQATHQINESQHWDRAMKTEFRGGMVLGFIFGAGLFAFFWLLVLWVDAGGVA
jgi:hypothetical protein